jgi:hypothetical protein
VDERRRDLDPAAASGRFIRKDEPVIANPYAGPAAYARDLARLRELTGPHLPYPAAPIGPALAHMTAADRAETIAILGRLGDPDESASG